MRVLSLILALFGASSWALAQGGVSASEVLLGQSAALQGPASALGTGMQTGLEAAFAEINGAGGVQGRKITLASINDGYEPDKTTLVTKTLIEKRDVFALIGAVGTPTSQAAVPICEGAGVPFLFPFTGAGFLRAAERTHVLNLRANYDTEMVELARYLVEERGLKKIACFYQDDAYGQVGLAGIEKALTARGMELVAKANYPRNTVAVAPAIKALEAASPDAVVMVGAYKPCAAFIKSARKAAGLEKSVYCNISFVGTSALLTELGPDAEGVVVSQVVPFPWDDSVPAVKSYLAAMKAAGKEKDIDFISLEGYLSGRLFAAILGEVQGTPTRESFLAAARSGKSYDLGGLTVAYGAGDHVGLEQVWLTQFTGGKVQPLRAGAPLGN